MKACDVIREVMKVRGMTVNGLVEKLGVKQSTMSQRLKQDNLSSDKMIDMLSAMDYRLVAVPIGKKLPDGSIEVTKEN